MEEKRTNYFWLIIILVIFLLTLGVLVYYIRFATTIAPKADTFNTVNAVSISNSYIFASPVRAKAGGDMIRVTVFLLDDQGNGIYDIKVNLRGNLIIKEIQSLTDETGKAMFDVASSVIGTYTLEAFTEKIILPQRIKVIYD
jgi:hypothetical protein